MNDHLSNPPAQPFAIGLKPLSARDFLQIDSELPRYRSEKRTLYKQQFERVCMAQKDTLDAQVEIEKLIHTNLTEHHTNLYSFDAETVVPDDGSEPVTRNAIMPIASTALLIQDDLLLMRQTEKGWTLVAASLCFPSSWNLKEKFGKPLEDIHAPVPMSAKMGTRITRIFDALKPETPLWRMNWSLETNGNLRHDKREHERKTALAGPVFFRSEFQTLHKLPTSKDVLFTVRIHTHPMGDFLSDSDGREKITLLHNQYRNMTDEERDYKGINNAHDLINWLKKEGNLNG